MWGGGFLKNIGSLLDAADDKTSTSDLQTLTREVATVAQAATEGAAGNLKRLDLGLVDGWNELTSQISGDLKGVSAKIAGKDTPTSERPGSAADPSAAPASQGQPEAAPAATAAPGAAATPPRALQRQQELSERVRELKAREAERLEARERLQQRYEEVEAELKKLQEEEPESSEEDEEDEEEEGGEASEQGEEAGASAGPAAPGAPAASAAERERNAKMEAMRREFCQRQAAADARAGELDAELRDAAANSEPVRVELEFWREKVQRTLAAQGLAEIPEAVRRRAERGDDRSDAGSGSADSDEEPDDAASARAQRELADLQAEHERALQARGDEQQRYELLEAQLADLMRRSDAEVEAADTERRRERELEAEVAAAEATAAAEAAAAQAAEQRVREAQQELDEAERELAAGVQREREAKAAQAAATASRRADAGGEEAELRRELEVVNSKAEAQRRENALLETRLRKCRAAAAADLERAVPLAAPSCWRSVDGPSLKVVTLLVRSPCLRRAFTVHLLGMYAWLFFMIFWLEKH